MDFVRRRGGLGAENFFNRMLNLSVSVINLCTHDMLQFDSATSNVDVTMVANIQNFEEQCVPAPVQELQEPLNLAH